MLFLLLNAHFNWLALLLLSVKQNRGACELSISKLALVDEPRVKLTLSMAEPPQGL